MSNQLDIRPGIWQVDYTDDYYDGNFSGKWRLTHHPRLTNRYTVERELNDGTFGPIMGDKELGWSKKTKQWYMPTFTSIVRVTNMKFIS